MSSGVGPMQAPWNMSTYKGGDYFYHHFVPLLLLLPPQPDFFWERKLFGYTTLGDNEQGNWFELAGAQFTRATKAYMRFHVRQKFKVQARNKFLLSQLTVALGGGGVSFTPWLFTKEKQFSLISKRYSQKRFSISFREKKKRKFTFLRILNRFKGITRRNLLNRFDQ